MSKMFILALLTLSVTITVEASVENTQECRQGDFRSYTHCITKRETAQWCEAEGCKSCTDNNCHLTCKGFSCGLCPDGDCCDGSKCNACYTTFCCSIASCNYCIQACRHACANDATCQNICMPQCQTVTHDVFIIPLSSQTPGTPEVLVYIKGRPHKGNITSGRIPTTNKTATVSIDKVDHPAIILMPFPNEPAKICQSPCNTSCSEINPTAPIQNCNVNCTKECSTQGQNYTLQPNCCHVVHPRQCYTNHIYPYRHCSARSHSECSNLCTSRFVHLTPQPRQQSQCHYIRNYPYIYCGQHSLQNCDPCYTCNGQYNPNFCVRQNSCSNVCRQNFLPPNLSKIQVRSVLPGFPQIQTAESHKRMIYPQNPVYQPILGYPPVPNMQFVRPFQYG